MPANPTLKALFEIARRQIISGSKDQTGAFNFPESYLYAVNARISPIFHSDGAEDDPFDGLYSADAKFVTAVTKWLDQEHLARREPTFYQMEDKFGHDRRIVLIRIVRYCALDNRFDQPFYRALLKNGDCPVEALHAAEPFKESDLSAM